MIKRIRKINQVGSFCKSNSTGTFNFDKVTIFHGRNTYGKSTLTDIFNSISENEPSYITNRKSIPDSIEKQKVELTYLKTGKEENLNFDTSWSNSELKGRLLVFDSNFIHKNLISGIEVTRGNKESFTDFILGEEGVVLSQTISEKKRTLATDKSNLKNIRPDYTRAFPDSAVNAFVNYKVIEDKAVLESEILKQKKVLQNIERVNEIKQLPTVNLVNSDSLLDIELINNKLNEILKLSFSGFTEENSTKFFEHLSKNTTNHSTTEDWVKEGFEKHIKSTHDICPFCSQEISSDLNLISVYTEYFNDEYGKYILNKINTPLNSLILNINQLSLDYIVTDFQKQILSLSKYKEYSEEIAKDLDLAKLSNLLETVKPQLTDYRKSLLEKINEKKLTPHKEIAEMQIESELLESVSAIKTELINLNTLLMQKVSLANALKLKYEALSTIQIEAKKTEVEKLVVNANYKLARIAQDTDCMKYRNEYDRLIKCETEIAELTKQLENQQSDYLKRYFTDLNSYFNKLGSRDFSLKCAESDRGYKKAYYLDVSFKNKPISIDKLNIVFSESDKRSLAFAIFLAKAKQMSGKDQITIVLDDPVVSFDENRIRITADLVSELSKEFEQLIILSHYRSFISKLADIKIENSVYFDITKDSDTCSFSLYDINELRMSEMDRAFDKVWGFINRVHTDNIAKDCRIFFENYLSLRFKKAIKEKSISYCNLCELITNLKDASVIDQTQYDKLEDFRKGTNGEHHTFSFDDNPEDIITYASSMLDYIYKL